MTRARSGLALLGLVALGACADVPLPYQLDHARVMAVRVDPPTLGPGERARVDVLVTDDATGARVVAPAQVTTPGPLTVGVDDAGWYLEAPRPIATPVATLALVVEVGDQRLTAEKTVGLGVRADNPTPPAIVHDGARVGTAVVIGPGEVELTVDTVGPELSYRWFSSVGELTGYTRAAAVLEPEPGARGQLGVVVRDQAGGVAWTLVPAEVVP